MRFPIFAIFFAIASLFVSVAPVASEAQNITAVNLPHATMPISSTPHVVEVHLGSSAAPNPLIVAPKFTLVNLSAPVYKASKQKPGTTYKPTAANFRRVPLASYVAGKAH
jgi:hypothetical protein